MFIFSDAYFILKELEQITVFDLANGRLVGSLPRQLSEWVHHSATGKFLSMGKSSIRIWNTEDLASVFLELPDAEALAFSHNGNWLAVARSGTNRSLEIWNLPLRSRVASYPNPDPIYGSLRFSDTSFSYIGHRT